MWIERYISKYPLYFGIPALFIVFIPEVIQLWWGFFSNDPIVPITVDKLKKMNMPDFSIKWLYYITVPLGFGMLVYIAYLTKKSKSRQVVEPDKIKSPLKTEVQEDGSSLVSNQNLSTLRDIAKNKSDPEIVLYDYGKYGFSVVPLGEKWANWISYEKGKKGLVATVSRPDLDYNDFGNEFHFVDLSNGKIISIPIGKLAKHLDISSSFHKGMVLRLMHKLNNDIAKERKLQVEEMLPKLTLGECMVLKEIIIKGGLTQGEIASYLKENGFDSPKYFFKTINCKLEILERNFVGNYTIKPAYEKIVYSLLKLK